MKWWKTAAPIAVGVVGIGALGWRYLRPSAPVSSPGLIDDFSDEHGISALGTQWDVMTDKVMGGVSSASSVREVLNGHQCIRLRGNVSLANQGGFVQVTLPLSSVGGFVDASKCTGVRFLSRGNGEEYYIHLRTIDTLLPWQYYTAAFTPVADWRPVHLPFLSFHPENLGATLDTSKLSRIAIVAAHRAYAADVAVAELGFDKQTGSHERVDAPAAVGTQYHGE